MSASPLTVEEARSLAINTSVRRLLAPEDVARLGVLPLAEDATGDQLTVAVGPQAPGNIERLLRARLGRRIETRPAARDVIETLLEIHFLPYWSEKGWHFPGLPDDPGEPAETARANAGEPAVAAAPAGPQAESATKGGAQDSQGDHPVILFVEVGEERRKALAAVLLESGHEPRFAGSLEDVARELQRTPPQVVVARRDGPVSVEDLVPLIRKTEGKVDLRVLKDYARALLGNDSDDRLPAFLFDLVRFFTGIMAAAGGAEVHRAEARARAAERAARRLGLQPREVEAARLAVLFEDLEGHLAKLTGKDGQAGGNERGTGEGLGQLLDPTRTPYPIGAALTARQERFDGSGPRGLAGESIPPAARIIAAVDEFFTGKDEGASGEALEARLRAEAGKRLDPRAVEAVLRAERAERLVDRLGAAEERVLVVDPDPVAASLLEMRLANAGFEVEVRRDGEAALRAATERAPDLIISEVGLPRLDGFTFLLRLRKNEPTREVPFIFVSERADRGSTMRGFELGADDYIAKPADLELLTAKVKGIIRKAQARRPAQPRTESGVSGNLADMGLVDLLQVLAASRKTVRLKIENGKGRAGECSLEKGKLVDARLGDMTGIDAFFELFCWPEGNFTVRAADSVTERTIDAPLEGLLLEACRARDEAGRS